MAPAQKCPLSTQDPSEILRVNDLEIGFASPDWGKGVGVAVDGVSFSLERGRTLCLVGESGCGKSVTALSLLRFLPSPPAVYLGGSVLFDGQDVAELPEAELRRIRGSRAGMIFQDPMTSLNPVMRIMDQMTEGLRLHRHVSAKEAESAALSMLMRVGIPDPAARLRDYPHRLSGGMRQRVMIGMALMCDPDLLIADEPTTALDVTVQKQILGLMRGLIEGSSSTLLLITHDLGVVAQIADDVAVMYSGRIVEQGVAGEVLASPAHPYTEGLLRSRPGHQKRGERLQAIPGSVPRLWARPGGCSFHPRCDRAFDRCKEEAPPFFELGNGRRARCWLLE